MQKFLRFLALVALTAVPWAANAQTMTTIVADGSATNDYVPVYGYWADAAQHNQIVYSEDLLSDIPGVTISGMKFYASTSPSWGNTATIKMAIVDSPTLTSLNTTATLQQVWSGSVSFTGNEWSITFTTPFTYTGGHLLVDITTTGGDYGSCSFYGIATTAAASRYSYDSYGYLSEGGLNFIPKTEFTHTIPVLSCYRPMDMTVSGITTDGATLSWSDTMNSGASYSIDYWKDGDTPSTVTTTATSYTFTGLDANSLYHFAVKTVCSANDESSTTSGSFATLCGGSTCNLTLNGGYYITFDLYQNGALKGSYETSGTAEVCSTDPVVVVVNNTSSWSAYDYSVTDLGGTALMSGNLYSGGTVTDTINTPCPTCIPPTALFVDSVSQDEITIGWTPRSGATLFAVYQDDSLVSDYVTDTFYTFTGLSTNTAYSFGVQAICTNDDSSTIVHIGSRTACGEITLPYFVDFEDVTHNGAWYPCWDSTIHAGTDPSVNDQNSPANHTAGGTYAMYLQGNSSENYNLVVSPAVPLAGDQIFVSFWARCSSSAWMKAGVMTNPRDTSTFIPLVDITGNNWNEYTFTTANLDPSATYYVAWLGHGVPSGYYSSTAFIGKFDDVLIREDLGCNKPNMAVVDSVGPYSADLRWSNGGAAASAYDVFYNTTNDLGTAMVESGVSDTVVTLSSLLPQTTYYCWVRTACGSDSSDAKAFPSFTTQMTCAPLTGVAMGNISYTAAQITWNYDTTQGFPTEGVHYVLTDNGDAAATPEEGDITGSNYTFTNLLPGHGYTVVLRNMCTAPGQTDTAAAVTVSFMTSSCAEIVSDGNTNNYIPTYTYYGNTYSQMLYLASEMPNIDTIHGIAFNITNRNTGNNEARMVDVYVKHVDTNAFNGNYYFPIDPTMVYTTNHVFHSNQTGWQVITFDSAFVYDGTSNLLITVNDHTNAYGSAATFAGISAPNRGKYSYRDNSPWTPADMTDAYNSNIIPAIRFVADCDVPQCFAPMLSLDSIDANNITVTWVSAGTESSWVVGIRAYGANDYTYEPTAVTDTFFTFTNLMGSSLYEIIVGSICNEGDTLFATLQATTPCAGTTCDIVIAAQDSYGDGWNNGTLKFFQNGAQVGSYSMPSQGLYSTVIYDTATVSVCSGIPVSYSWQTGSYDSEISYVIYNGGGVEEYNSATSGVNHSGTIVDACPTCFAPTGLVVTAVDSNSIAFTWTEDPDVSHYLVSFNGGAYTAPNDGTNEHSEIGLTPNTTYTISVIAVCDPGIDTSAPRTLTVKTSCGPMVLPYVEGFESDPAGNTPSCWNVVSGNPTNYGYVAHGGSQSLYFTASGMIATSLVPLDGDSIYVSFWANHSGGTLEAGVMTDLMADSTFVPLYTGTSTNGYELIEFNTANLNHYENYYVAFRYTAGFYYLNLDDINIRKNEGCMYPANLTATPAAHEVDLTWVNNSSNSDFVVQYRAVTATAWDTTIDVFDTTYTVTNLNAATSYVFRVGYLCNNDTLWSTINAQTTCDLISLPYFENFDAYANDVLPPCWDYDQAGVTHWDGGLFFRSNSSGGTGAYAVVPQLAGNFTKLKIEFDTKVGTIAEQDGILLGAADATGTLVGWLDTIQDVNHSRNGFVHHIITMVGYNIPAGAERVVFAQYRSWGEWALIDNISIEQLPDCYPVDSLEAHNLIDPDHTNFTWQSLGNESEWQVYVDTATIDINTVPDSLLTTVYSRYYEIPMGTIQGGGIYTFYVRANCGQDQSTWTSYTFGAGTYVMNNSATADTVVACGLVVYDNGGPIAGYLPNSNSALVIRSENVGSQLEVFGGAFGFGSNAATLTIYDGEGTTGAVLYTYNTINGRDTLNSVLATSTTGALTITFVSTGQMCHTGYELYIHCVGTALCERPTQLNAVMTGLGAATVTWMGTAASYDLYYKPVDAAAWAIQSGINGTTTTLTGLLPDTTYTLQVVGICGNDTSTPSFPAVLNTHFDVLPCDPVTGLTVGNVTTTTATLSWNSTADTWEIELSNVSGSTTITTTSNPHTLINLLPNMGYSARVRALCGAGFEPSSQWSAPVTFTTDTVPSQGIEGVDSYNSFVLYPNPATTTVTIDLTGVEDAALVSIIDLNGRKVYSEQVIDERMTVDVSALAKGAYFVRITGSNTTAVRKLIVK